MPITLTSQTRVNARPDARLRGARGFTLIEVLVALFILAILAAMAFRGVDALVHVKDGALASTDHTLALNTGMSQFDYDVSQIVDSKVMPQPIMFDGATLRIARRTPDGLQLVLWTLQDHCWQRWAGAPVTHMSELTDELARSQQWDAISGNAVTVLRDVSDFQIYLYNNGWSNVQSTQTSAAAKAAAANVTAQEAITGVTTNAVNSVVPTGIRIMVKVPEGEIVREKELPHWS